MRAKAVISAALTAASLALAGCGSSPPAARSVAMRIPGCHPRFITDVSVYAPRLR